MAALLTSVTGSTDDVVKYINECREMGISVEPPDINVSDANFTPHGSAIRFGLAAVKNVGRNAIESIVAARKKLGKVRIDFRILRKSRPAPAQQARARVVDQERRHGLLGRRAQLMAVLDRAIEGAQKSQRDAESGQHGLFGIFQQDEASAQSNEQTSQRPRLGRAPAPCRGKRNPRILHHRPSRWRNIAKSWKICTRSIPQRSRDMKNSTGKDETITTAGMIGNIRVLKSKKGDFYAQATLEDMAGSIDMIVFPEAYVD